MLTQQILVGRILFADTLVLGAAMLAQVAIALKRRRNVDLRRTVTVPFGMICEFG